MRTVSKAQPAVCASGVSVLAMDTREGRAAMPAARVIYLEPDLGRALTR